MFSLVVMHLLIGKCYDCSFVNMKMTWFDSKDVYTKMCVKYSNIPLNKFVCPCQPPRSDKNDGKVEQNSIPCFARGMVLLVWQWKPLANCETQVIVFAAPNVSNFQTLSIQFSPKKKDKCCGIFWFSQNFFLRQFLLKWHLSSRADALWCVCGLSGIDVIKQTGGSTHGAMWACSSSFTNNN